MLVWITAALGLIILLLAGDALVRGAVNLSLRVGIPAMIVSLTIVAFGTSAPELLIAISAIDDGAPGIALGNVIGSNTANILLVLGLPAILSRLHTSTCDTRRNYVFMLAATALFIVLALTGIFTWVSGLILLAALAFVLGDALRATLKHRKDGKVACADGADLDDLEGADPEMPWWRIGVFLALGLIGLPFGADLLVDSAIDIARRFDVGEAVIGLTLVAVGTSLPELATTVMAALRRQADVALGNVIGSNMFNLLAIIGIASFIGPIPVDPEFIEFDLWVMAGASLLILPFVWFKADITRRWGVLLTALYVVYILAVLA
ncbi:calcium/sodium antiporter [Cognatishimia maritima]|uniref:Cation:H+ antiporter n=1 Tax=Cognatishimia maritima TaxID=870908 RepID=A0A1M5RML5_9RHOB|nr:calcium/sodium antiporter [Cognatishimia maritima]SHH27564.1 cation:H+ antiporter [Cognatishimia maritima]